MKRPVHELTKSLLFAAFSIIMETFFPKSLLRRFAEDEA